ncbi:glyoxalase [Baekduia soli]|uniref:Glyoxalase n=1 Tax=Baekduia soli TaxID=496014 RepID=A0A5B8U968_9ACTN|nr:VOC family protein [Baekduia soli]QEC49328.1 glyoxalase [Baekduia soli]
MPSTTSSITEIGRVIIPVADQDRALAFYTEKLGLDVIADIPFGEGDRWIEVAPPGARTAVAFGPVLDGRVGVPTGVSFKTPDADALHDELAARGVDVDDVIAPPGAPRMFFFRDADSNTLHAAQEV